MANNNRTIEALVANLSATRQMARQTTWQYFEVKQLAEILARHRMALRGTIKAYRTLVQTIAQEKDAIEKLYLGYEAMFARDHLRDAVRLYVMVNHDYHEAQNAYMNELKKSSSYTNVYVLKELPPANSNRKAA